MVGEPLGEMPRIGSLYWDFAPRGNVEHIARHDVTPADVEGVLNLAPRFFNSLRDPECVVAVGQNGPGRWLVVVLAPTSVPFEWAIVTAHWMTRHRAEGLYGRGLQ
jgi:hypothetical protein